MKTKHKLFKVFIFFTICLIQTSCYFVPCLNTTDLEVINKISDNSLLIGTYKIEKKKLDFIFGYDNSELNLKNDGTFEITNASIDFFTIGNFDNNKVNTNGKWNVEKGKYTLRLNIDSTKHFRNSYNSTNWDIYIKNKKPVIVIEYGDPDSCYAARYFKE